MIEAPQLDELLLSFESFGDNCEMGLIQRQAGLEPLGLLRFSFTPLNSLLRALDREFGDVAAPDNIEITTAPNKELIVTVRGYEFVYHSQRNEGDIAPDELKRQEITKLKFLSRKTADSLRDNDRIFVRKGGDIKSRDDLMMLHTAMSKYGTPTLLWVTEADADNPSGSVRLVAPGLLWGRIDYFAPYDDAHSTSFTAWVHMLRNAYVLWKSKSPVGTVRMTASGQDWEKNLLCTPQADERIDGLPRILLQTHNVKNTSILGPFPHRAAGRTSICATVLISDGLAMVGVRASGLTAGQSYVFSLWLRLAEDAKIEQAWVLFAGDDATVRHRRIRWSARNVWQRLENVGIAPANGIMFPRINLVGAAGAVVYTANWRLEPGVLVESDEHPELPVLPPGQHSAVSHS